MTGMPQKTAHLAAAVHHACCVAVANHESNAGADGASRIAGTEIQTITTHTHITHEGGLHDTFTRQSR